MANLEESSPLLKNPDGRDEAAPEPQRNAPREASPKLPGKAPSPPRTKEPAPPVTHLKAPEPQPDAPPQASSKIPEKAPPARTKEPAPPVTHLKAPDQPSDQASPKKHEKKWHADGLPVPCGSVIGEPVGRVKWHSGVFDCFCRNDEFCSSDLEVCLLGTCLPCALYGSNVERLGAVPGSFADHCLSYTGLYMLGNALFGWNCLAPCFAHFTRTAIRHKFNLEGTFEAFSRSSGCCQGLVEDEVRREQLERQCDLATHYMCHTFALCQEGRELRRRLPHPGFHMQPVLVMMPPAEQTMRRQPGTPGA
ncbi:cell number regulator 8-like [Canna indica]|uniref:Cell number regulator 8-like n=1 Tax=Canna indica TaxID=4628 RepID=A0AAQ3K4V7_9LILI|nr:cell number regulator 8-like [Canna indica]